MKKNIILIILCAFLITGCGKSSLSKAIERIEENSEKIEKKIEEQMEAISEEAEKITIPNITGLDIKSIKAQLENIGFKVEIKYEYDDDVKKGEIIRISPLAGTKNDIGSTVTIYVSNGSENIEIEDYLGKNYQEVKNSLESKGLNVIIETTEAVDDMFTEGMIARQSIDPGTKVKSGETITLYIPNINSTYPDFTSGEYTLNDVQAFCDKYGISLTTENDEEAASGTITYQSRAAGSKVISHSSLTIKIGVK